MGKQKKKDKWSIFHFSISNSDGKGQGDVVALLRRAADVLNEYGNVQVQDITFASEVTGSEDQLTLTVYYHRESRRR